MNQEAPLFFPLNRPQYVPAAEVLVSALVWGSGRWAYGDDNVHASRFLGESDKEGVVISAPNTSEKQIAFAKVLRSYGMQTEASDEVLVRAVVSGITGVRSAKAKTVPVSPMTTHLALAQSLRGVLGAKNPPDMAGVLETMFALGESESRPGGPRISMASRWVLAADLRMVDDPVLRATDTAMASGLGLKSTGTDRVSLDESSLAPWRGQLRETPYGWLHDQWVKLTSPEWVEALPPRVWTDWCTTVLRMGIAFGFLFESRWFEAVGRSILSGDDVPLSMLDSSAPLLQWPGARLPVSSRNNKPQMRRMVGGGVLTRAALQDYFGSGSDVTLQDALQQARRDPELKQAVRDALSGRSWPGSCKNMYETILYSLQQRDSSTEVDYYGLLRKHGNRYSVIQPGTEWIAVIASLACDEPSGETNLGQVLATLGQLGLRPELLELVKALEAAGLAQGSADADRGVRVRSAY
ncbi:hypothetical protein [Janibacter sp. Soil728]|uniref:hypothetical protein n=1 Tax=Janibacter sp. Soil728 TaxID=1736393 RepID=UPI000AEF1B6F|nr:hypothetical protein [Janibacter sp. Soil728]